MNKKHGVFTEPGTIRFERLVNGPIEKVWDYLTKSELKEKWLSSGDVEAKVGGTVTHEFDHTRLSNQEDPFPEKYKDMEEGAVSKGVVITYDAPNILSYTWEEDDGFGSEVTFELSSKSDNKVLLVLTHRMLPEDPATKAGIGAGWHTHLSVLSDRLASTETKGFWGIHMPLEKKYAELISKLTKHGS